MTKENESKSDNTLQIDSTSFWNSIGVMESTLFFQPSYLGSLLPNLNLVLLKRELLHICPAKYLCPLLK